MPKKISFPIFLSVITAFISFFPLLINPKNPFFDVDPEVMYISNAVANSDHHKFPFMGHPGTPYVLALSLSYAPLKFYAVHVSHQPFVEWYLANISSVFYYSRLIAALIFTLGLFTLLWGIKKSTGSSWLTFLFWLLLFQLPDMLQYGMRVMPETPTLLLVGIWLLLFFRFLKKPSTNIAVIMTFLSAYSVGLKYTNLGILTLSFCLGLYLEYTRSGFSCLLRRAFCLLIAGTAGYLAATWAIKSSYLVQLQWIYDLANHSDFYGSGNQTLFEWVVYRSSLLYNLNGLKLPIILFTFTLGVVNLKTSSEKLNRRLLQITFANILIFFFLFAKFPKLHYQLPHLLITLALFTNQMKRNLLITLPLAALLLWNLPKTVNTYWKVTDHIKKVQSLQVFIDQNPPKILTLWEWGYSRDFALLWGYWWSGEYYRSQLNKIYPHLGLDARFEHALELPFCWDQFYVQNVSLQQFKLLNQGSGFRYQDIYDTGMTLVSSNHCAN